MKLKEENNSLSSFYRERFNSFSAHLIMAKNLDEESIHKLRVDIKNIRSLLLLLVEHNHETILGTKLLKQLKEIFKCSGKLRVLQVSKSLLLKNDVVISMDMIDILDVEINELNDKVKKCLSKFDLPKFEKRVSILCSSLMDVNYLELVIKVDGLIYDELEIINKLFNSSQRDEYYHVIRKLLKFIKSLQQLLVNLKEDAGRKQALDIVNSTEKLLGSWHDYKCLDTFISKLGERAFDSNSKRIFRNLKNQNNIVKLEMKNEVDKYLRNHF